MAAEVLSHHQVPTAKPEEASRPDADVQGVSKRNYVPIRPAYRPLLPKPSTRDSTPSPIHIHTRTSGLGQLACRKRHSGVTAKIDTVKRRRSLATRVSEHARTTALQEIKPESKTTVSASVLVPSTTHSSPSPPSSNVSSPSAMDSPNMTSVSTRSIFGPPPSQSIDSLANGVMTTLFDSESSKPRGMAENMTSVMSGIVNRFQQQPQRSASSSASADSSIESADVADVHSQEPSVFSQLPLNQYNDMPLEQLDLDQFNKLDMDLEPTISSTSSSAAASLASSAATSTSTNASNSLDIVTTMSEDRKKQPSQSPETFSGYGSPTADFDDFTDLYFHSATQFDSVTPTDGSPETLGDVLDNEVGLVDKNIQDDLSMMDFLAPVDLFNA